MQDGVTKAWPEGLIEQLRSSQKTQRKQRMISLQLNLIIVFWVVSKSPQGFSVNPLPHSRSSCFICGSKYSPAWLCSCEARAPADWGVGIRSWSSSVFCSLGDESCWFSEKRGPLRPVSPDRPQRRPCRWKPSQDSSPKFLLNFCPFYFFQPRVCFAV